MEASGHCREEHARRPLGPRAPAPFFSVARWQALFAHRLPGRQLLLSAGLVLEMWRRLRQARGLGGTHPHERFSRLVQHRIENFQVFQREASVPPFRTHSVSWISPSIIRHSCPIKTPINHATHDGASRDLDAQLPDHERWRHVRVWQQVARPRGSRWPGMVGGPYVHGWQRLF